MKIKSLLTCISLLFIIYSCDDPSTSRIKKDLSSRWTKFEIIEVKKDSANVRMATNIFRSLSLQVKDANVAILQSLINIENKKAPDNIEQNYINIDTTYKNIQGKLDNFLNSESKNMESCFYVKYLVSVNEKKIPKEELYFINNQNGDIIHRPSNWKDFLNELGWDKVVNESVKYLSELNNIKAKLKYKN
ncbi:MAG: hypothetical protein HXX16_20115 [Bacteroidales bacterium]|nr:hypothetical protein [Bacteroidales bacterium]